MIRSSDLREALASLIKIKAGLNLRVFYNHVENCAENYCWVRLRPKHTNESFGIIQRKIRVDFQIVLSPINGQVKHTDLLDIIDKLDEVTCEPLKIGDRFITIYDAESIIFDNILTYSFIVDFTDCVETYFELMKEFEFMEKLEVRNLDDKNFIVEE